ncbi:hypothetical protein [Rathayibacter sp. VKM Ac-2801]|uniref:hypothetical protein n=1 Tax=Rathayibacter sp. VKM Ac-2801 TaxID=2609255 RepID=UPI0013200B86|nr:hypothetical protein [Rathayibacter sp. VKM Ac-2801]QHC71039.1 hypothetical protein GSU45_12095 [Rathayibacter sp. VKM Ac-2801]
MISNLTTTACDLVTIKPAVVEEEQPAVHLSLNAIDGSLLPAEAVRLGVELIAAAHRAEMRSPDDWLEEVNDE